MTIRTACSAGLVALHEACAAVSRGDCEAALVGGVNLLLAPGMTVAMTEQGVLSKDGICKTFSADANGYARGEAVTAVYVKPLTDAIRDGNPVRAVIRGTSHNSDGKTPGMSQPSTDAQETLIRKAYDVAGITNYSETGMVECHGTGTKIGDPIETRAVARVFGEKGVYIGSVKPNLGHTEGASGLVSLIKMVMALEHRTIPPNIRFTSPNPDIPFDAGKLKVPLEPTPWPEDRFERVSLNAFGVGGANAHAVVESAAAHHVPAAIHETPETPQLLLYTANSAKSLTRMIENYQMWVEKNPEKVSDLAYTLAMRRMHLPHRAYAIVKNGAIESTSPPSNLNKLAGKPNLVMVFTGQGAQWPQMGRELLQHNKTFKASIQSLDKHLQNLLENKPQYSILEELRKPPKKSRMSLAELSQPLCTAIQIALVDTLKSLEIMPSAVVGHSSGEIAAAYASGALTAAEAIIAAHHRGAVAARQKRQGSMAAIGLSWEQTEKYLIPNVTIACDNSPQSVTISGDVDAVKAVTAKVKESQPDALARALQVDKAYHSYHMAEIGMDYLSLIGHDVIGQTPVTPFFSSVDGQLLTSERTLGSKYWKQNLESPVRFREAVTAILHHEFGKNAVFLEVGPHSALMGPLRQIFSSTSTPAPYVSTMARNQDCVGSLLIAIGKLHSLNVPVNLRNLFTTGICLPDLPRYPWNHEDSFWYESRISKEWRQRKYPYHDLLGARLPGNTNLEPIWRNLVHLTNAPWLRDHKVGENIVFPFCGYLALAGEAIRQMSETSDGYSVRNITVHAALVLTEGKPTEIMSTFHPHRLTDSLNSSWWEFTVAAYNGHAWTKHCTGEVSALASDQESGHAPKALPRKVVAKRWYETMCKGGLDLGPCFQSLKSIETSSNSENRALARVAKSEHGDEANFHIHPTVLDGLLQLMGAAAVNGYARKTKTWLPTSIEAISVRRCSSDMTTSVSAKLSSNHSVVGEGCCVSEGATVVKASGIKMSVADAALSSGEAFSAHAAARYEWHPDIDFVDVKELIRTPPHSPENLHLLEELGNLCLLSCKRQYSKSEIALPHLQKYMAWLVSQAPSAVSNLTLTSNSVDNGTISARIEALVSQLSNTSGASAASSVYHVYKKMDHVLTGQTLTEILPEGTLTSLYRFLEQSDRRKFIQHLAHSKPNLRILELGTGSDMQRHDIVDELTRNEGQLLCSRYTFTSPGYISAKDQQKMFPGMEFRTLDINQDPVEQGFEDREYDLIIATNALHMNQNLRAGLANVNKLLSPDGRLLLQELTPSSKWMNFVFGILPTWWSDIVDGRAESRLSISNLETELAAAGFTQIDAKLLDGEEDHHLTVSMIARRTPLAVADNKKITVLHEGQGKVLGTVTGQLEKHGYHVDMCTLNDVPPPGQDVISLLDATGPFFESIDDSSFLNFKGFIQGLQDSGIFWITHPSEIGCQDPRYAQVTGLARVIRSEMLCDFATCQVDDMIDHGCIDDVIRVFGKFQTRQHDGVLNPDFEWAVMNGQIQVGRFQPFALPDELSLVESDEKATLDVETPGRINSLHWVRQPRDHLEADEVEVQVHSAGLNFRVS